VYTLGIDIGSISTKAAVLNETGLVHTKVALTGYNAEMAASRIYTEVLADAGLASSSIGLVVATGYGRKSCSQAGKTYTEIMCHAAGARYLCPDVRGIIDIGGQDSKAILLDNGGKVANFVMNDKCAAGTGRFLEVMARALEVDLDAFGTLSLQSRNPSKISSLCTVFAESEVISLIAKGENRENIIAGIHEAISSRVLAMARRIGLTGLIMMTGGVAKNIGVVSALEAALGQAVVVSEHAQVNGAIGAACLAMTLLREEMGRDDIA
jgi:(R)-2-hydroxyacyl-CoA dehydratese activating ATPase